MNNETGLDLENYVIEEKDPNRTRSPYTDNFTERVGYGSDTIKIIKNFMNQDELKFYTIGLISYMQQIKILWIMILKSDKH
jgi:predicted DNA-binding protein with PD1-like motif